MKHRIFAFSLTLGLLLAVIGFGYIRSFDIQTIFLEGTLVQKSPLPTGTIGIQCNAGHCSYCLAMESNKNTCIFTSLNQCRASCGLASNLSGSSAPALGSSSPLKSVGGNQSSSAPRCRGDECTKGGNVYCAQNGLTCEQLSLAPCTRCIAGRTSSAPSCRGDECTKGGNVFCAQSGLTCEQLSLAPCTRCIAGRTSSVPKSSIPSVPVAADFSVFLASEELRTGRSETVTIEVIVRNTGPWRGTAAVTLEIGDMEFVSSPTSPSTCWTKDSLPSSIVQCGDYDLAAGRQQSAFVTLRIPPKTRSCNAPRSLVASVVPHGAWDNYPQNNTSNVLVVHASCN